MASFRALRIHPCGRVAHHHFPAVLIDGRDGEVDEMLTVLVPDRGDGRGRIQGVARPHLVGESYAEFLESGVADVSSSASCR